MVDPPQLGPVTLSGTQTIAVFYDQNIVEHRLPLTGGIVEHLGSQAVKFTLEGFYATSDPADMAKADEFQRSLIDLRNKSQDLTIPLVVPSVQGANVWKTENVFVEQLLWTQQPGTSYPYYRWVMHLKGGLSGAISPPERLIENQVSGVSYVFPPLQTTVEGLYVLVS